MRRQIYVAAFVAVAVSFSAMAQEDTVDIKMAMNTPRLQLFQGDGTNFVLTDPLVYRIKKTGKTIIVPEGFVTDFATVPWYARSVISVLGRHSIPAIVHDYLYWEQRCKREQADAIIEEAMAEYGSTPFQRLVVSYAVRYRASGAWEENAADRRKGLIKILTGVYKKIPLNTEWNDYRKFLKDQNVQEPPLEAGTPAYCTLSK